MDQYQIINLNREADYWDDFYELPERVYCNDENYTRPNKDKNVHEVKRLISNNSLPLLIIKNDKVVARLIALESERLVQIDSEKLGMIAFFEAFNDQEAVNLLFDEAVKWFQQQSISNVIGPINGDTWHRYRFVTEFKSRPFFLSEPYNPGYYPELWENYGFSKLAGYYSKFIPDVEPVMPKMKKFYERTLRNGFSYRPINMGDFENELRIIYRISRDSFANNFLYKEIDESEFLSLYDGAKGIVKPELIWFCLDKEQEPCGFAFAIPDYGEALRQMRGKKTFWAKLKFLFHARKVDTVNLKSIGTLSQCRNNGVGPGLTYKVYEAAQQIGINKINMCLIHDDNVSGKLDGSHGEILRRYAIYSKET